MENRTRIYLRFILLPALCVNLTVWVDLPAAADFNICTNSSAEPASQTL